MVDRATYKDLVQEILDELLLQRSRGQQSVEISPEKLGNEVSGSNVRYPGSAHSEKCLQILERRNKNVAETDDLSRYV